MADLDHPVVLSPNTKQPTSELAAQKINPPPKILSGFLCKAILFAFFVAVLPLFPPQVPESTNHTLLSRTWELLHLLLVGIAVSYGLFSHRNADADLDKDKDHVFKVDTPQSYVSRILQVSPVFDDYVEAEAGADTADESKVETWNFLYHSADPVFVVANGEGSGRKPLLLPVRSLKNTRVQNSDGLKESRVLPSPIPWRSRSGRLEAGDESSAISASSGTPSFRSPPLASLSESKTSENSFLEKLKRSDRAAPPPVPPSPPPPPISHGSICAEKGVVKMSFKDELEDLSRKGREGFFRSRYVVAEQVKSKMPSSPKSIRTVRTNETQTADRAPNMLQKKYKAEFMEKMILISEDSDRKIGSDSLDDGEHNQSIAVGAALQENEVDKKADEFIAKFREQIRLQRIESLKKSSGHKSVRNPDI